MQIHQRTWVGSIMATQGLCRARHNRKPTVFLAGNSECCAQGPPEATPPLVAVSWVCGARKTYLSPQGKSLPTNFVAFFFSVKPGSSELGAIRAVLHRTLAPPGGGRLRSAARVAPSPEELRTPPPKHRPSHFSPAFFYLSANTSRTWEPPVLYICSL